MGEVGNPDESSYERIPQFRYCDTNVALFRAGPAGAPVKYAMRFLDCTFSSLHGEIFSELQSLPEAVGKDNAYSIFRGQAAREGEPAASLRFIVIGVGNYPARIDVIAGPFTHAERGESISGVEFDFGRVLGGGRPSLATSVKIKCNTPHSP